ncbi:DUF4360 domain-containing protein [Pilimelia terevasa]|nr:DUF4360 domain-containing protein [Pilimelia terevasa]
MKRTGTVLATLAAGLALAPPAAAAAPPASDYPDAQLTDVQATGTGCTRGNTVAVTSNGGRALDVIYSAFHVESGAVPADDGTTTWIPRASRHCRVSLTLTYLPGWTFALTAYGLRGTATLAAGSTGRRTAVHHVDGLPAPMASTRDLAGPMDGAFAMYREAAPPVYGECGRPRRWELSNTATVDSGDTAKATRDEVMLDSTSLGVYDKYHLAWRRC